jgi:hypothetical protein
LLLGAHNERLEIHQSNEGMEWIKEVKDVVYYSNNGLDKFQFTSRHLKRDEVCCHLVQRCICDPEIKLHDPSPNLDAKFTCNQMEDVGPHKLT